MKLEDVPEHPWIWITTNHNIDIYFVDPAVANDIRTEETLDAKISIGPSSNDQYIFENVEIEYIVHDNSIHDGSTCTDYKKQKTTYGTCLKNILKLKFLSRYGCMPPWVYGSNLEQVCEEGKMIAAGANMDDFIYITIWFLTGNFEADIFHTCLPPCTTMITKVQEVHRGEYLDYAYLEAKSKKWAAVHTQVYSYDIFSLTVDLGSALGLWMGLSCLSILDHILLNWINIKKYLGL